MSFRVALCFVESGYFHPFPPGWMWSKRCKVKVTKCGEWGEKWGERWCWVQHLIFPLSQQNCRELVRHWLSGGDVSKRASLICLSCTLSVHLAGAQSICEIKQEETRVSQITFTFCWCCNSSSDGLTILIAVPPAAIDGLTWSRFLYIP